MLHRFSVLALAAALSPLAAAAQGLVVEPGFDAAGWVRRGDPIEVVVRRPANAESARLVVLIGELDATDLFRATERGLVYRPELLPLPAGEHEIVVYEVGDDGGWGEVGRMPLRVLHRGGFEEAVLTPRLDVESAALLDDRAGAVDTGFDTFSGQIATEARLVRGASAVEARFDLVGVGEREAALRFASEGDEAPQLDLSSYRLGFSRRGTEVALGHVTFGASRQLIDGFSSRGLTVSLPIGRRLSVGLGAMNGTAIAGWDNPLGLADQDHRVLAGQLAYELLPDDPGALRLEGTWLDARQLPRSGFAEQELTDREENGGWSVGIAGRLLDQRLRLAAGWGEASSDNPADPLLAQGAELVPVDEETRSARYVDLDWDLVRGGDEDSPLVVTVGLRHERVEPLYRSVAAPIQSDVDRDRVDLTVGWGAVSGRLTWSDQRDNLDDIESILTTRTERRGASLTLPFAALLAAAAADGQPAERPWLPVLSYGFDQTHQAGDGVPVGGGFDPSHVPDQLSRSHHARLDWQGARWRSGATFGWSEQDNRQPGREASDFTALVHGWSGGWTPHPRLDLSLDLSRERGDDRERGELSRTDRGGLTADWRITDWTSLSASASQTEADTEADTETLRRLESTILDLVWNLRLDFDLTPAHGVAPQLFVRYAWQQTASEDSVFGLADSFQDWSLSSGVSLSLY